MLLDRLAGVVLTPLRSVKTTPAIGHFYLGEHRTFLFCFDNIFIIFVNEIPKKISSHRRTNTAPKG
jgi:hypothetical protein